jgi:hypothetical protein
MREHDMIPLALILEHTLILIDVYPATYVKDYYTTLADTPTYLISK